MQSQSFLFFTRILAVNIRNPGFLTFLAIFLALIEPIPYSGNATICWLDTRLP